MNEEYRWFYDFQAAYGRLAEIENLEKFLELEISMYGSDCTLGETRKRLTEEYAKTQRNMLDYFKEKEESK